MCLILFATHPSDRYRLVVAANRDELFARPATPAAFWEGSAGVLAGIDQTAGGTWLGVNRRGAFAAVTNFREEPPDPLPPRSRGDLPSAFLTGDRDPRTYVSEVSTRGPEYRGFNLIVADHTHCCYYGNRGGSPRQLEPGYYGLSNQLLDCDWPKVVEGRERLKSLDLEADDLAEKLFTLLTHTGDNREFSNSFINGDTYGTRAATIVLIENSGQVYFEERNFGREGVTLGKTSFSYIADS